MNDTILARRRLRLAVAAVLEVLVGVKLDSPGDWESIPRDLPSIKLRNDIDRKVSLARSTPSFTTTINLELIARVQGETAEEAQDAIDDLGFRIENAVMAAPSFIKWLQQIAGVTTTTRITSEAKRHVGEIQMMVECETFETFDPVLINPDDYPELLQLVLNVDTISPFDPGAGSTFAPFTVLDDVGDGLVAGSSASGNYPNPPFPGSVTPAPRTAGPDGRNEGTLVLDLS